MKTGEASIADLLYQYMLDHPNMEVNSRELANGLYLSVKQIAGNMGSLMRSKRGYRIKKVSAGVYRYNLNGEVVDADALAEAVNKTSLEGAETSFESGARVFFLILKQFGDGYIAFFEDGIYEIRRILSLAD